jgi:hypothetical protein
MAQGIQNELGAHPSGARNPYDAHIGRILHPGHPDEVGGAVAAPIAQKGNDFGFPVFHAL